MRSISKPPLPRKGAARGAPFRFAIHATFFWGGVRGSAASRRCLTRRRVSPPKHGSTTELATSRIPSYGPPHPIPLPHEKRPQHVMNWDVHQCRFSRGRGGLETLK